jgi:signal transduction histidine kinase
VRSVYAKVLVWSLGTLLLSLVAFIGVSLFVSIRDAGGGPGQRFEASQLPFVVEVYERDGASGLRRVLDRIDAQTRGTHYLLAADGRDVLTGEDRSAAVSPVRTFGPPKYKGHIVNSVRSADGRYYYVSLMDPPVEFRRYIPYYLLILCAVALMCWLLSSQIARPLRTLTRTVESFGSGDLAARAGSRRRDEIGELGRAFDTMAERISTLLAAERRLLQDVSHELRTPLARISFAAAVAAGGKDSGEAQEILRKEIRRLSDLVAALLQVTRAEGDAASARLETLDLDDVVAEVVQDCWLDSDARDCRIAFDRRKGVFIDGDREVLRRAVENVVMNAIRFTTRGASVNIELATSGPTARIAVRDFGPGVPEQAIEKIFDPFFRVDAARQTDTGGIGLGLSIAQRAISLHRGRIWAENVHPGLRVVIELPASSSAAA